MIKRIVAVGGNIVEVARGELFIDGVAQEEDFTESKPCYVYAGRTVQKGEVFVLGDNRNDSRDGHVWGMLPVKNIVGRVAQIL